jgi:hypothetical protein
MHRMPATPSKSVHNICLSASLCIAAKGEHHKQQTQKKSQFSPPRASNLPRLCTASIINHGFSPGITLLCRNLISHPRSRTLAKLSQTEDLPTCYCLPAIRVVKVARCLADHHRRLLWLCKVLLPWQQHG